LRPLVREVVGAFLLEVLGSRELAPSGCRQASCVTPTVRLLLVLPYCSKAVLGDTETTQDGFQNINIYWRGSIGQEHIATTSPQRWRRYHVRYVATARRAPHRPMSRAQLTK